MDDEMLGDLDRELHDLCQPLTALQCRLELAQMMGDAVSLKEAVDEAVDDIQRIFAGIAQMRKRLAQEE